MESSGLFQNEKTVAIVAHVREDRINELRKAILQTIEEDSVVYQKVSSDNLYITTSDPRKEGDKNGNSERG